MGEKYYFKLKQVAGKSTNPVVEVGQSVKRGQLIADLPKDQLGVPLHSSIDGVVKEITDEMIIIEEDATDFGQYVKLTKAEPIEMVRQAGIAGMGGAGFPSYIKLQTELKAGGYLIVNASECEPILNHNMVQIEEETEKLIDAIQLTLDISGAEKAIIGIKLIHKKEIKKLTQTIKKKGANIRIQPLKNIYPVGEERALIKVCLNTLLDPDALPAEANAIVFNVETLIAIYEAIENRKPLMDKWMTLAGNLKDLPDQEVVVKKYPLGKSLDQIIEDYGGLTEKSGEIIIGGPYMGHTKRAGEAVEKTTGGLIVANKVAQVNGKLGIIQCACSAKKERMLAIAEAMNAEVVGYLVCKNAVEKGAGYKCKDPGNCPGQAEKVLELYKDGAEEILIGHCYDCTNTVMQAAPKLNIPVHHVTDHALEAMGMEKIRYLK